MFYSGWGTRRVSITNTLSATALSLWNTFSSGWGNRKVSVTNSLANSAATLWNTFTSGWGTRKVSITNSLSSTAPTLWSAFNSAWGTRKVSITNTLSNTASTLWNNFKSGWSGKTLSLTVTYSTNVSAIKKAVYKVLGLSGWPTIKFAARGGIVDAATLFGNTVVGEAGAEAIVPLENHTEWLDKLADRLVSRLADANGGDGQTINVTVTLDGQVVGRSAVKYIKDQNRRGNNPLGSAI